MAGRRFVAREGCVCIRATNPGNPRAAKGLGAKNALHDGMVQKVGLSGDRHSWHPWLPPETERYRTRRARSFLTANALRCAAVLLKCLAKLSGTGTLVTLSRTVPARRLRHLDLEELRRVPRRTPTPGNLHESGGPAQLHRRRGRSVPDAGRR